MKNLSRWYVSVTLISAFGCNREPAPKSNRLTRSQFLLVTHQKITSDAAAIASCNNICKAESAHWNGYFSTSNPFMMTESGLCECIRAQDPYPDELPLTFRLKTSEIEGTYGRIAAIAAKMENNGLNLDAEASASAGEGGAGGSANSTTGKGASASASTGSASATANSASAAAGAAAGGGQGSISTSRDRFAKSDGTTDRDGLGTDHSSLVAKSNSSSSESDSYTVQAKPSAGGVESNGFEGDTFAQREKLGAVSVSVGINNGVNNSGGPADAVGVGSTVGPQSAGGR